MCWYTGRAFEQKIEELGINFEPMRRPPDFSTSPARVMRTNLLEINNVVKRVFVDWAIAQMEDLEQLLNRFEADEIVCDAVFMGAVLLKEKRRKLEFPEIPLVVLSFIPLALSSRSAAPFGLCCSPKNPLVRLHLLQRPANWMVKMWLRSAYKYAEHYRLKLGLNARRSWFFDWFVEECAGYLQCTVPEFEYLRRDQSEKVKFVGALTPLKDNFEKPPWWDEVTDIKRTVVHVTQGTAATDPHQLLIPTLRALANEDYLVVATTGRTDQPVDCFPMHPLPGNVRLAPFVPHSELLPHVKVMITNAGYGGVTSALANGVPLVAAGFNEDKGEIAARIAWRGVGRNLRSESPFQWRIRRAVRKVLQDESYTKQARDIQEQLAKCDGVKNVCDKIEGILAK